MPAKQIVMNAAQFKRIRRQLDLSAYKLRECLGVSLRHVYRYECGEVLIPGAVARLMVMFERYGVPSDWL